jgi:mannose-6-phosphate isomerase-like protein (cupin superfamily)
VDHVNRLQVVDLLALSQSISEEYKNFIVTQINQSCLRLAVFVGSYPWHRHPNSDELFLVLEGELFIDIQGEDTVVVKPNQVFNIPANVVHRTRAVQRVVNLCFEYTEAHTEFIEVE